MAEELTLKTKIVRVDLQSGGLAGGFSVRVKQIADLDPLLARVKVEDDIPFWAELWPSSLALARYLWQGADLTGYKTLELGAGLGLSGIVAGLKGASVLQTDLVVESLNWARENAVLNGLETIRYQQADWRDFRVEGTFDLIIGSDVLYEPKLHPHLESILSSRLAPGGRTCLADPGRTGGELFIETLQGKGWSVTKETITVLHDGLTNSINIYQVERRN
ncbi:MAG TPA: methyltransferase domain-containing protein [Bacillota bacterium]|nr:methyltransferase domain-containing protein [Bacillota bacterium]